MEAAKSRFSYICLSREVLLKARGGLLTTSIVKAICNFLGALGQRWETQLPLVPVRKE